MDWLTLVLSLAVPRPKKRKRRRKKSDSFVVYQGSRLNQLAQWLRGGARLPGGKGHAQHA
jgi:hypothetical protein